METLIKRYVDAGVFQNKIIVSSSPSICNWSVSRSCLVGENGIEPLELINDANNKRLTCENNRLVSMQNRTEINIEEIKNIGFKNKTSKILRLWTNTIIRDTLIDIGSEIGVQLKFQSSAYRSQRCSCCGLVRKSNRKGKNYSCVNCGLEIDADLNAAKNHEIDLPEIPYDWRTSMLDNKKGFFWDPKGLFNMDGSELRVPVSNKI
jgi:hypothetical protein